MIQKNRQKPNKIFFSFSMLLKLTVFGLSLFTVTHQEKNKTQKKIYMYLY